MQNNININSTGEEIIQLDWEEEGQDKYENDNNHLQGLFQYRDNDIFNEIITDQYLSTSQANVQKHTSILPSFNNPSKVNNSATINFDLNHCQDDQHLYHQSYNNNGINHNKTSDKQKHYSKTYRERVKDKYKLLQEENTYLKKRINDLQSQVREQQLELNRFKYPPPDKELSVEQLNKEFTDLSFNYLNSLKQKPEHYDKQHHSNQSQFYQFFLKFYADRGFAGKKKLKILNYHFNQLLQTLLKDTEKYLSLVFANSPSCDKLGPLPQFQTINNAYFEIYKPQGDLWSRLKMFNKFLHPMSLQLNKLISQFYKKYEEILHCCDKMHSLIKHHYQHNMDIGRRRLQAQTWFDFHKYTKTMRNLRFKWFDWMKSLAQKQKSDQKQKQKEKKCQKRKKIIE